MGQSWIILIPTILTIVVCLATKKIFVGMFVGIFSGCIILAGGNPLTGLGMSFDKLIGVVSSAWNVKLILFATLIGGHDQAHAGFRCRKRPDSVAAEESQNHHARQGTVFDLAHRCAAVL